MFLMTSESFMEYREYKASNHARYILNDLLKVYLEFVPANKVDQTLFIAKKVPVLGKI